MEPFHYFTTVFESYVDYYGHVHHAAYLTLFELARWELYDLRGLGLKKVQAIQTGPIILEANIQYKKELMVRTQIKISSSYFQNDKKIGQIHQKLFDLNGILYC